MEVNVHHAKTHLSKLISAAESGEEVIIARNGKPVVKLVLIEPKKKSRKDIVGSGIGKIWVSPDFYLKGSFYDNEIADLFEEFQGTTWLRILVDSHSYVWTKLNDPRLSRKAKSIMRSDEHELFFSLASLWELSLKIRKGQLRTLTSSIAFLHDSLVEDGITLLPIRYEDVLAVEHLDMHHRDPFDRMLIAPGDKSRPIHTDQRHRHQALFGDHSHLVRLSGSNGALTPHLQQRKVITASKARRASPFLGQSIADICRGRTLNPFDTGACTKKMERAYKRRPCLTSSRLT